MTRLSTNLYLEIAAGQVISLLRSGTPLPAAWQQTFSTFFDQQQALDLHLLAGQEKEESNKVTAGRWQINEIPTGKRGEIEIQVRVEVNTKGQVLVSAQHAARSLPVTPLTTFPANLPVKTDRPGPTPESAAKQSLDLHHLGAEQIQQLRARGYEINAQGRLVAGSRPQKKGLFRRRKEPIAELTPDEILSLAGEPLAPEESQRCPNPKCRAVIHINARRCEWCGRRLKD